MQGMVIKYNLESLDPMIESFYDSLEENIINAVIKENFSDTEWYIIKSHGNLLVQFVDIDFYKHIVPVRCSYNDTDIYFAPEDDEITYEELYLSYLNYAEDFDCFLDSEIVCNCYDSDYYEEAQKNDPQYIRGKEFINVAEFEPEHKTLYIEKPLLRPVDQEEIKFAQTYLLWIKIVIFP